MASHSSISRAKFKRLQRLQEDVQVNFGIHLQMLETKYQSLITNIVNQKAVVLQKLVQNYTKQMNMINQMKSIVFDIDTQYKEKVDNHDCLRSKFNIAIVKSELKDTRAHSNSIIMTSNDFGCLNSGVFGNYVNTSAPCPSSHNSVDINIPIAVKREKLNHDQGCIRNDDKVAVNTNCTSDNSNTNEDNNNNHNNINDNHDNHDSNNETNFNVVETDERMKCKIRTHITKLEKTINGKKYQCNDCSKMFKTPNQSMSHVAHKHIDEKPFNCNHCDKSFALWRWWSQHQNVHTTKFQCKYCKKRCRSSQVLKSHERVHTNEKPFKCDYPGCNQAFSLKGNWKRHQRIHTGEKPFECDICNKKFTYWQTRKDHKVKMHAPTKSYT